MSLAHLDRAARQPAAMANDVERPRRARGGIVESCARTGVNPAAAIASTPAKRPPLSAVGVPCFVGSVQDGVVREQVHTYVSRRVRVITKGEKAHQPPELN